MDTLRCLADKRPALQLKLFRTKTSSFSVAATSGIQGASLQRGRDSPVFSRNRSPVAPCENFHLFINSRLRIFYKTAHPTEILHYLRFWEFTVRIFNLRVLSFIGQKWYLAYCSCLMWWDFPPRTSKVLISKVPSLLEPLWTELRGIIRNPLEIVQKHLRVLSITGQKWYFANFATT